MSQSNPVSSTERFLTISMKTLLNEEVSRNTIKKVFGRNLTLKGCVKTYLRKMVMYAVYCARREGVSDSY